MRKAKSLDPDRMPRGHFSLKQNNDDINLSKHPLVDKWTQPFHESRLVLLAKMGKLITRLIFPHHFDRAHE